MHKYIYGKCKCLVNLYESIKEGFGLKGSTWSDLVKNICFCVWTSLLINNIQYNLYFPVYVSQVEYFFSNHICNTPYCTLYTTVWTTFYNHHLCVLKIFDKCKSIFFLSEQWNMCFQEWVRCSLKTTQCSCAITCHFQEAL